MSNVSSGRSARECLDHVIILNERHLRHVLSSYFQYHHDARTRISRSTRIVHGLVRYSYPPQAITLSFSRRWAGCIIAMSVELRRMGEAARCSLPSIAPN